MELYWRATYIDGTSLSQYNEDKSENKYVDIDRACLKEFGLYQKFSENSYVSIHFEKGMRLIYRRRVAMEFTLDSEAKIKRVIHIIGWQKSVGGNNQQFTMFVWDGSKHIEVTNGFKEDTQFYPIVFLPEEQ